MADAVEAVSAVGSLEKQGSRGHCSQQAPSLSEKLQSNIRLCFIRIVIKCFLTS